MEKAYLDSNRRRYELVKEISLLRLDPLALLQLKETGACEVVLPEALFDADYPGHYMRRIKSVSVTVPCVVGPYTNVNCTLTLLSSTIRVKPETRAGKYEEDTEGNDPWFLNDFGAVQSIATSHAQNDAGLFELNFRDERYLPFEGAGAVSRWRIGLPTEYDPPDVLLKLSFEAWEGGAPLCQAATDALDKLRKNPEQPMVRLFSARHEFPNEWYRFLHPPESGTDQVLELQLAPDRFPYIFRGRTVAISRLHVFLDVSDEPTESDRTKTYRQVYESSTNPLTLQLAPVAAGGNVQTITLASIKEKLDGMPHHANIEFSGDANTSLKMSASQIQLGETDATFVDAVDAQQPKRLRTEALSDLLLAVEYSLSA